MRKRAFLANKSTEKLEQTKNKQPKLIFIWWSSLSEFSVLKKYDPSNATEALTSKKVATAKPRSRTGNKRRQD